MPLSEPSCNRRIGGFEARISGFDTGILDSLAGLPPVSLPSRWLSASKARSIPSSSTASFWKSVTSLIRRSATVFPRKSASRSTNASKFWKPFAEYSLRD